jgi:hypothetical protein
VVKIPVPGTVYVYGLRLVQGNVVTSAGGSVPSAAVAMATPAQQQQQSQPKPRRILLFTDPATGEALKLGSGGN